MFWSFSVNVLPSWLRKADQWILDYRVVTNEKPRHYELFSADQLLRNVSVLSETVFTAVQDFMSLHMHLSLNEFLSCNDAGSTKQTIWRQVTYSVFIFVKYIMENTILARGGYTTFLYTAETVLKVQFWVKLKKKTNLDLFMYSKKGKECDKQAPKTITIPGKCIEDIYFFEVNTKYISSNVLKISVISRVCRNLPKKVNFLFIFSVQG